MKKHYLFLSVFLWLTATAHSIIAQTYVPVVVSGFNHDLIAEGSGGTNRAENTTTISFDLTGGFGGSNVMYSTDFRGNKNPNSPPLFGLPTSRIINSANLPGASYTLADYSANNTLFLAETGSSGNLTLQTPGVFSTIAILGSSSEGASNFSVQLNFSDGSNFSPSFTVPDWFNGSNFAIKAIGRVTRTTTYKNSADDFTGDSENPRLYDNKITLPSPFNNRILTSVTFTKTSQNGRTAILALTGITAVDAPAPPVALPATAVGTNSATANWQATPNAVDYFLDVSESPTFSTFVTGYNNLVVSNAPMKEIIGLNPNIAYYYRVRASNNNGTSASSNTVTFTTTGTPPCPTFTYTITDVKCNGGSDGSVAITVSGGTSPYQYSTDGGQTYGNSSSFTNLAAGTYLIKVKDANGCETEAEVTVTQPKAALSFSSPMSTKVTCNGGSDGSITVSASGGTPGYTYTLNPGNVQNSTGSFAGLMAGSSYVVMVKDANNCTASTGAITVTQPPVLNVSVSGNTSVTLGYGVNCTTLSASSGTAGLSYSWSSGATTASTQVCPATTTTYTVTVTDASGCQATAQVQVTVQDVRCGNKNDKVIVCHNGKELCISPNAVKAHLDHGDQLGTCGGSSARIAVEESRTSPLQLTLTAYPNPTPDAVTVQVLAPMAGAATFEVLDITGRPQQSRTKELIEGLNEVEFSLGALPTGIYMIRAIDALGRQGTARVSKQ